MSFLATVVLMLKSLDLSAKNRGRSVILLLLVRLQNLSDTCGKAQHDMQQTRASVSHKPDSFMSRLQCDVG